MCRALAHSRGRSAASDGLSQPTVGEVKDEMRLCLDDLFSGVASACPQLAKVRMRDAYDDATCFTLTDVGLAALAQLRKLKRFEVWAITDVTQAGVLALALNASVEAIRVESCDQFKRGDAQFVMNVVQRPYLDVTVM